jgi:hypothetical protein
MSWKTGKFRILTPLTIVTYLATTSKTLYDPGCAQSIASTG